MAGGPAFGRCLATAEEPGGIVIAEQLPVGGGGHARHHRNGGQDAKAAGQDPQQHNAYLQHQQAQYRPPQPLHRGEAHLQGLDGAKARMEELLVWLVIGRFDLAWLTRFIIPVPLALVNGIFNFK